MSLTRQDIVNLGMVLTGIAVIALVIISSQLTAPNNILTPTNALSLSLSRNDYLAALPQFERTDWYNQFTIPRTAYPARITIPSLDISSEILGVSVDSNGLIVAPPRSVGHFMQSARPDENNNIVLVGHSGTGLVFEQLASIEIGDTLTISTMDAQDHIYIVEDLLIVPVKDASLEQSQANIDMIMPSIDENLTIITCYPRDEYTHRLIVRAIPAEAMQ